MGSVFQLLAKEKLNHNKANNLSPHLIGADTDLRSFQLAWSVWIGWHRGQDVLFSSHTYAAYTCCTLRAWIEIWWNHLKCCVQHILMMQSWSCRRNIYPPTYFAKFTCLNRIQYEKSTEHAKDPWNRRGKSSEHWYGWVEQATTVEGGAPPAADWTPCFIRSISQADEEGRKWRNAWGRQLSYGFKR